MGKILGAVVIGAGWAGLSVSYCLKQRGLSHEVLERARIGEVWRTQRWDSFLLNSSNIRSILPGDTYEGPDPWGAVSHHAFVAYLEDYAGRHRLPVRTGVEVTRLARENGLYRAETDQGAFLAQVAVVATGHQSRQVRPLWSNGVPQQIRQIDSSAYRNPAAVPEGAILVVGSGQTGGQIAEDLVQAGRRVFLATSRTSRLVRRYRGGDALNWLTVCGFADVPRRDILGQHGRLPARPLLGATHTISLQSLAAQGVVLLGRFTGITDGYLTFGDDIAENVRFADDSSSEVKRIIDAYIMREGLAAPPAEDDPAETVAFELPDPPVRSIEIASCGISSIIWCAGLVGDYSFLDVPGALDESGQPLHEDGVGSVPGLYYSGLDYGTTRKSGTVPAAAEEANATADHIAKVLADASPPVAAGSAARH